MLSEKLSQVVHNLSKEQLEEEIISLAKEVDRLQGIEQRVVELSNLIQKTPILKIKCRDTDTDMPVDEKENMKEAANALINLARVNKS